MPLFRKRASEKSPAQTRFRALQVESLESRQLLSATPWGAAPLDTAEYLLGDVGVTLVLMESQGAVSSEDWTAQSIIDAKDKVAEGLQWWEDTLAAHSSVHSLNFVLDTTYADNPVPTSLEPIANVSNSYVTWVNEFLTHAQVNTGEGISTDIRLFNDSQRQALNTHWAFTIFVVNDENDSDGKFAPGGSFSRAFAFPGGQFYVAPADRPAATFSHELGHIFWARDEYSGAGSYTDKRGYYDAQNLNAANNPAGGFQQVDSIMASGTLMDNAYAQHASSPSSLEMMGWRDTDGDGVFDVLDVPHELTGTGYYDSVTSKYRFLGEATVQALPNLNSSGQQNDIVLSQVDVVEYRLDGGDWQILESPGSYQAQLDLSIPAGPVVQVVEVRTRSIDPGTSQTVSTSELFWGRTDLVTTTAEAGIRGVVWNDANGNGQWAPGELGLEGWDVRLIDTAGDPVELATYVEPDDFSDNDVLNSANSAVDLSPIGANIGNVLVLSLASQHTSTGSRVFANQSWSQGAVTTDWIADQSELRMNFSTPVTYVSLDA
ncbi:MAG: protein containing Planctomycete extracellular domain protein, partial [Pirellulaceae bacterium]